MSISNDAKVLMDGVSLGTVISTLFGWLPHVAAMLTIIWTTLRIYEWFEARQARKPAVRRK